MDETYVTDVAGECFHVHDCDDDTDHDTDHDTDDDTDDDTTLKKSETNSTIMADPPHPRITNL